MTCMAESKGHAALFNSQLDCQFYWLSPGLSSMGLLRRCFRCLQQIAVKVRSLEQLKF